MRFETMNDIETLKRIDWIYWSMMRWYVLGLEDFWRGLYNYNRRMVE